MDGFGRVIDYLRISVTDRCNERCLYCMPEGYTGWAQKADHLTADEIMRVAEAACALDFVSFGSRAASPAFERICFRLPRGSRLARSAIIGGLDERHAFASLAVPLREAGVDAVNMSLDALDAALYREDHRRGSFRCAFRD